MMVNCVFWMCVFLLLDLVYQTPFSKEEEEKKRHIGLIDVIQATIFYMCKQL